MIRVPDIDPAATANLVVDVQVDFCSEAGRTARRHRIRDMTGLPGRLGPYLERSSRVVPLTVFTQAVVDEATTPDNVRLFRKLRGVTPSCLRGTGGEALCDLFMPEGAVVLEKTHIDPFARTGLGELLSGHGIRNVVVTGVRTELCVEATARRAVAEGFHTIVLSDLVATRDEEVEAGDRALEFFESHFGYVCESGDLLAAWGLGRKG